MVVPQHIESLPQIVVCSGLVCVICHTTILSHAAGKISSGAYDQRDIDRLDQEDGYARCFLRTLAAKGDPNKAADVVDTAFTFRKEFGIWGFNFINFLY